MEPETDMELETGIETETEDDNMQTWTWTRTRSWNWGTFAKYLIRRNSPYSAIRIAANMSQRNFPRHFLLVEPLRDERMTQKLYRNWNCSSNDVLAKLERSVWG
jgi:hypothetical protein